MCLPYACRNHKMNKGRGPPEFPSNLKHCDSVSCLCQWDSGSRTGGLQRENLCLPSSLETFIATHSLHQLESEFMESSRKHHFRKCLNCRYQLGAQAK